MNRRHDGSAGEEIVVNFLQGKGFNIKARNYLCKTGEIDIVAEKSGIIIFVEVKARRNMHYGRPSEAVTPSKLRRIERTAEWYMCSNRLHNCPARIDVVEVWWTPEGVRIEHLENVTG